jgi:hypothetical protein
MKFYSEELLLSSPQKFEPITFYSNSTWTVPRGIKQIGIVCAGAQGCGLNSSVIGGYGGLVTCTLKVTPGQTLYIVVGLARTSNSQSYNASDIRTESDNLYSRLIVAGGGGNYSSGSRLSYSGGNGGGTTGSPGNYGQSWSGISGGSVYAVAQGGTQTDGGAGGACTAAGYINYDNRTSGKGTFGSGGAGVGNGTAGCGGAGYFGGGGGVSGNFTDKKTQGCSVCSGAGGSSYTHPTLCTSVSHEGYNPGNGYITISMV